MAPRQADPPTPREIEPVLASEKLGPSGRSIGAHDAASTRPELLENRNEPILARSTSVSKVTPAPHAAIFARVARDIAADDDAIAPMLGRELTDVDGQHRLASRSAVAIFFLEIPNGDVVPRGRVVVEKHLYLLG